MSKEDVRDVEATEGKGRPAGDGKDRLDGSRDGDGKYGDGKGTPPPTPSKPRTICGVPLIPQPHGGALLAGGKPGNPGGGRIADKVRLDATKGLEPEVSRIAGLLSTMVGRAESELGEGGSLDKALATMREIGRIANTLTSIGPGTKVTTSVSRLEFIDAAVRAFQSVARYAQANGIDFPPELEVKFHDALPAELESA